MESLNQINASSYDFVPKTGAKGQVLAAIKSASESSGVDFSYLLSKAEQESGLDPKAKATTSSATGLYQFIDQTWLQVMKQSGDKYGLGAYADKISVGSDGVARVANAADKRAILALRENPEIAAEMAAELTKSNQQVLSRKVGGEIGSTELYLAHFLGASGASSFLSAMKNNPGAKAASILPEAASANKNVFYDKSTGRARSVGEIYQRFAAKFDNTDTGTRYADASSSVAPAVKREMILASLSSGSSSSSGWRPEISIGDTTETSFATMLLAQMDIESFGLEAIADAEREAFGASRENERKLSAYSMIG